jgi:hypothetical protein
MKRLRQFGLSSLAALALTAGFGSAARAGATGTGPSQVVCDRVEAALVTATMFRVSVTAHADNTNITGYRFIFSNHASEATESAEHPFIDVVAPSQPELVQVQVLSDAGETPVSEQCSVTLSAAGRGAGVPTTTAPPTTTTPPATTQALPPTGASGLTGVMGVAAIGWAGRLYLRSRRNRG